MSEGNGEGIEVKDKREEQPIEAEWCIEGSRGIEGKQIEVPDVIPRTRLFFPQTLSLLRRLPLLTLPLHSLCSLNLTCVSYCPLPVSLLLSQLRTPGNDRAKVYYLWVLQDGGWGHSRYADTNGESWISTQQGWAKVLWFRCASPDSDHPLAS